MNAHTKSTDTARKMKKRLSRGQRVTVTALTAAQLALAAAAATDLARRPSSDIRGPKFLWSLAIPINWIGPIAYFTLGRVNPRELPRLK